MMPRGEERLVARMSQANPVVATGEVVDLTDEVQFCAYTGRNNKRNRERRNIFTEGSSELACSLVAGMVDQDICTVAFIKLYTSVRIDISHKLVVFQSQLFE